MFEKSAKEFYFKFMLYFLSTVLAGVVTKCATAPVLNTVSIMSFLLSCIAVLVIPNVVFLLFFARSEECRIWKKRLSEMVAKIRGK